VRGHIGIFQIEGKDMQVFRMEHSSWKNCEDVMANVAEAKGHRMEMKL
jgi:hypothetical protein